MPKPSFSRNSVTCGVAGLLALPLAAVPVASFDVNDAESGPFTEAGWTPVSGATNDADTISGSDGSHTLTLTTSDDGGDRERNAGSFPVAADLWRDFWFVSGTGAVASVSGLEPDRDYSVEIWGYDLASTSPRSAVWSDAVTGNSATLAFDGGVAGSVPASLADSVAVIAARSDGTGVLTLVASGGGGLPDIFVNGLRVSEGGASALVEVEAEDGTLGGDFAVATVGGSTAAGVTTTTAALDAPGDPARVAGYELQFPAAGSYSLYARIWVGANGFNDDSLFHATGFGAKQPDAAADWAMTNGLAAAGYSAPGDIVDGGGSAGSGEWKWIRLGGPLNVPEGALEQGYQLAGREDGLHIDRLVFAPAELSLSVAELETGVIDQPESFPGPDGIAIHRFGAPSGARTADGAHPAGALVPVDGQLVGSTLAGGITAAGATFRVSPDGGEFEVLTRFLGPLSGAHPRGALDVTAGGFLAVTSGGGANASGAIVELGADGSAGPLLHSFAALDEHTGANLGGAVPVGPLAVDGTTRFGAASAGGAFSQGTLFSIGEDGSDFTVLHEFSDLDPASGTNGDGARPEAGLIHHDGRLFGTTTAGGSGGSGVVFSLADDGSDFTVLHHFSALDPASGTNPDGALPCAALTHGDGILYGSCLAGGDGGNGTIFSIATDGTGFTTRFAFPAFDSGVAGTNAAGARPAARLVLSGQRLFGVAAAGGAGTGTVFALDLETSEVDVLHRFEPLGEDGTNRFGAHPVAPLLPLGPALYGTTFGGGPGTTGTVFRIPFPLSARIELDGNPDGTIDATFIGRGAPFGSYLVQVTGDLAIWDDLLMASADASGTIVFDEPGLEVPARFYRLVEP